MIKQVEKLQAKKAVLEEQLKNIEAEIEDARILDELNEKQARELAEELKNSWFADASNHTLIRTGDEYIEDRGRIPVTIHYLELDEGHARTRSYEFQAIPAKIAKLRRIGSLTASETLECMRDASDIMGKAVEEATDNIRKAVNEIFSQFEGDDA